MFRTKGRGMSEKEISIGQDVPSAPLPQNCIRKGEYVRFEKDRTIMKMGTVPEKLYYLRSGKVRLVEFSREGERCNVLDLESEHFVGETRFLAAVPIHFNVETLTDVGMVAFSRNVVNELLFNDERFRYCLFVSMAKKMHYLSRAFLDCAYEDNCSRIYKFLKTFSKKNGSDNRIFLTQQEIAEFLGIHRITVHRTLHKLEKQGRISLGRKSITLT